MSTTTSSAGPTDPQDRLLREYTWYEYIAQTVEYVEVWLSGPRWLYLSNMNRGAHSVGKTVDVMNLSNKRSLT